MFRIKHPDAWHIMMYSRAKNWDGYVKYISDYGQFKIGLLNKVYNECLKMGQKVKIIDNRLPLGIKPVIPTVVGDKELREVQKEALENSVIFRDMSSRSQETVKIDKLLEYIKSVK